jgi:hypothetical protein
MQLTRLSRAWLRNFGAKSRKKVFEEALVTAERVAATLEPVLVPRPSSRWGE